MELPELEEALHPTGVVSGPRRHDPVIGQEVPNGLHDSAQIKRWLLYRVARKICLVVSQLTEPLFSHNVLVENCQTQLVNEVGNIPLNGEIGNDRATQADAVLA